VVTMTLRAQLERNLQAMARELARDPSADQREWCAMAGEVFGFEVTQIVSSPNSGDQNCHRFPSVKSTGDENCQLAVTKIVTSENDPTNNHALS
jgi:hypothetical protein